MWGTYSNRRRDKHKLTLKTKIWRTFCNKKKISFPWNHLIHLLILQVEVLSNSSFSNGSESSNKWNLNLPCIHRMYMQVQIQSLRGYMHVYITFWTCHVSCHDWPKKKITFRAKLTLLKPWPHSFIKLW